MNNNNIIVLAEINVIIETIPHTGQTSQYSFESAEGKQENRLILRTYRILAEEIIRISAQRNFVFSVLPPSIL